MFDDCAFLLCTNEVCNWHGILGITFRATEVWRISEDEVTVKCPKCHRIHTINKTDIFTWLSTFSSVTFSKYDERENGKLLIDLVEDKVYYRKGDGYIDTGFTPEQIHKNKLLFNRFMSLAD